MQELAFKVLVDEHLPEELPDAVAFGRFRKASGGVVYTRLRPFFSDLVLGRPLPLVFATRDLNKTSTLVALVFFLHRDLVLLPAALSLTAFVDTVESWGLPGLAHIDRDLARFLALLNSFVSDANRAERQERLAVAIRWIRDYLVEGKLPALPPEADPPRVIDRGTNGFVVAEAASGVALEESWLELFRQGYLRGIVFSPSVDDRRRVLVGRKSKFLRLDLALAERILNEAEAAMGEPTGWQASKLWLQGPPQGTLILVSKLIDVLVRM